MRPPKQHDRDMEIELDPLTVCHGELCATHNFHGVARRARRAEWENAGLRMFIGEVRRVLEMTNMPETVRRLDAFMEEINR